MDHETGEGYPGERTAAALISVVYIYFAILLLKESYYGLVRSVRGKEQDMINDKRIIVVLPAYKAAGTVERTVREVPSGCVDQFILVDDCSPDDTLAVARTLGIRAFQHEKNLGYGGNQKTCYRLALESGADIVVMLHPDYQYEPRLVPVMAQMVASGVYDVVLGSRILGKGALAGGMPLYKYISNRILTLAENWLIGQKLSEYHTGYRAYSRSALMAVDWMKNSDDFIFDNQILVQFLACGLRVGEISCPTRYFAEASTINFRRSVQYGMGVLWIALCYRLRMWGWMGSGKRMGVLL